MQGITTAGRTGWTFIAQAWVNAQGAPNPVVATRPAPDGGTARLYANGMVDAVDGVEYSLSPGFDSFAALCDWVFDNSAPVMEACDCYVITEPGGDGPYRHFIPCCDAHAEGRDLS